MGFWSKFGKIAGIAAPILAAPFTGGTSLLASGGLGGKILQGATKAAPILGGMSKAQSESRRADAQDQLSRDALALQRYDRERALPGQRMDLSTRASMIKNRMPVTSEWGGPGSGLSGGKVTFRGGFANPNLIDPRTAQLADDILAKELQGQLAGTGGPPTITPRPRTNFGEKILGGAAAATGILGAFPRRRPPVVEEDTPYPIAEDEM